MQLRPFSLARYKALSHQGIKVYGVSGLPNSAMTIEMVILPNFFLFALSFSKNNLCL